MNKDIRKVVKSALQAGCDIKRGSRHHILTLPGADGHVIIPTGKKVHSSTVNQVRRNLARLGVDI